MITTPAVSEGALEAAGAVVTPTSLTITNPDVSLEQYIAAAAFVGEVNRACAWWAGDLYLAAEMKFGEDAAAIGDALGLAPQTIANRISVAKHIPPNRRRSLPFGTHAEVAYLEPKERDRWLKLAEEGGWTRARLREEMRSVRGEPESSPVALQGVTGKNPSGEGTAGTNSRSPAGLLGDPVPDSIICPHCGERIDRLS